MAKKQATATETAAAAAPARAATPKANTRVRTVKHSKTVTAESSTIAAEPVVSQLDAVLVDTPRTQSDQSTDHHAAISRIAYSYWESRGYQGGSQTEDWLRAEQEYRQSLAQL